MIINQHRIYRRDLKNNPTVYYLFGDNTVRVGLGGQAKEMRGEPNALGIATKKSPSEYFYDDTLIANMITIWTDLQPAFMKILVGQTVVIPSDGLGTGLSKLPEKAPKTNGGLLYLLNHLMIIDKEEMQNNRDDMFEELKEHVEERLY